MHVHSIVFIDAAPGEIIDHSAFHVAAQFGRYDSMITIRCSDRGQELALSCPAGRCWGWRYFYNEWRRRFGE